MRCHGRFNPHISIRAATTSSAALRIRPHSRIAFKVPRYYSHLNGLLIFRRQERPSKKKKKETYAKV